MNHTLKMNEQQTSRKGAKKVIESELCAFAPLRETFSSHNKK